MVVVDVFVAVKVDNVEEITVDMREAAAAVVVVMLLVLAAVVLFTFECPFAKTNILVTFLIQ